MSDRGENFRQGHLPIHLNYELIRVGDKSKAYEYLLVAKMTISTRNRHGEELIARCT